MGSAKMTEVSTIVAGIDVGKAWLDVAVAGRPERLRVVADPSGHLELIAWLEAADVSLVGMEASGGYERPVASSLREAGFKVRVLQPAQVRAYAAFRLQRAKNDKIDAGLIAQSTAAAATPAADPCPGLEALAEHLTLLEQIEEDLVRAKTRLEGFRHPRQRDLLTAEIQRLRQRRKAELEALTQALQEVESLARRLELVRSVQGVGLRTAIALVVRMPELGSLSREKVASLAGLAPFDDDSGKRRGARHIKGGRTRLRTSLYAAALPAAFRWNPALGALYKRLTAKGKPHKLALVACARKLLIFVNTVLQRQTPWTAAPHA
jgi:transposase